MTKHIPEPDKLYKETLDAATRAHDKLIELHESRLKQHITNGRIKNCTREMSAIIKILKQYP